MPEAPVFTLDDATVQKGRKVILKNISWSVQTGERWVVLGPNGGGKSTLLDLLSMYNFPARGKFHIFGKEMGKFNVRKERPRIGYMGASMKARLSSSITVINTVATALHGALSHHWNSYSESEMAKAYGLLSLMGCQDLAEKPLFKCSSGEIQRVSLARTLMSDPELLLLDEPASSLDLAGREDLLQRLNKLGEINLTSVLVTHHTEEIPSAFDKLLLLKDGEILKAGPIAGVLNSENLNTCFDGSYKVSNHNNRWLTQAV